MAFQKRRDLGLVFFVEQRTRGVQQFTTSREEPPQRTQYALLLRRELRDVGRAPQPLHVGMTAYYARARAWNVREYAVELAPVPPIPRRGRVTADRAPVESEARKIRAQALQPCIVRVKREQLNVGELEQMARFSAGRRAGIEHSLPARDVQ